LFRANEGEFASDAPQVTSYSFVARLWNRRGLSAQASCLAGAKNFAEAADYAGGLATNFDTGVGCPNAMGKEHAMAGGEAPRLKRLEPWLSTLALACKNRRT
jgi:hypothetical protein